MSDDISLVIALCLYQFVVVIDAGLPILMLLDVCVLF